MGITKGMGRKSAKQRVVSGNSDSRRTILIKPSPFNHFDISTIERTRRSGGMRECISVSEGSLRATGDAACSSR